MAGCPGSHRHGGGGYAYVYPRQCTATDGAGHRCEFVEGHGVMYPYEHVGGGTSYVSSSLMDHGAPSWGSWWRTEERA